MHLQFECVLAVCALASTIACDAIDLRRTDPVSHRGGFRGQVSVEDGVPVVSYSSTAFARVPQFRLEEEPLLELKGLRTDTAGGFLADSVDLFQSPDAIISLMSDGSYVFSEFAKSPQLFHLEPDLRHGHLLFRDDEPAFASTMVFRDTVCGYEMRRAIARCRNVRGGVERIISLGAPHDTGVRIVSPIPVGATRQVYGLFQSGIDSTTQLLIANRDLGNPRSIPLVRDTKLPWLFAGGHWFVGPAPRTLPYLAVVDSVVAVGWGSRGYEFDMYNRDAGRMLRVRVDVPPRPAPPDPHLPHDSLLPAYTQMLGTPGGLLWVVYQGSDSVWEATAFVSDGRMVGHLQGSGGYVTAMADDRVIVLARGRHSGNVLYRIVPR